MRRNLPTKVRNAVLKRDGYKCTRCGDGEKLVVHHKTPVSEGGSDEMDNLLTLCRRCHKEVHIEREEYYGPKPDGYYQRKAEEDQRLIAEIGYAAFTDMYIERLRKWHAQRPGMKTRRTRARTA